MNIWISKAYTPNYQWDDGFAPLIWDHEPTYNEIYEELKRRNPVELHSIEDHEWRLYIDTKRHKVII